MRLRSFAEADAADVFDYASDSAVARFVCWEPHAQPSDSLDFIRRVQAQNPAVEMTWAVVWKATGRVIGSTGFIRLEPANATAEVGTAIHRQYWGSGANTEAKRLLLGYGLRALGLRRLCARTDARNVRSQRALEKLGFIKEGVLRRYPVVKGEAIDTVIYSMLAEEWEEGGFAAGRR